VKVRVRSIGLSGEAGTFIAQDKGYFKQEGLDIEFTTGLGTPETITGLLSGSLDLAAMALDVSLLNAIQRNVDLKILSPQTFTPPGDKNASIIVRKDLVDSGAYKGPQDLKGKNIAIGSADKTSAQLYVEKALAKGGLKASDANLLPLNFPDELAALGGKKVDAGWEVEPLGTAAEGQSLAVEVVWSGELFPNYDPFLIVESPNFAKSQPEALKRFEAAHLRGQRDFYDAFQKGNGDVGAQAPIFDIMAKYTTVKDPKTWQAVTVKGRMQSVDPNDAFHLLGFDELQDYFIRVGTLQTKIDVSKVIDTGPVNYALQRLGKL
jgi:NitT/TauT family transport system substrate-binding protein